MIIDRKKLIGSILIYTVLMLPARAMPSCLPIDGDYQLLSDYRVESKLYSYYFGTFKNAPNRAFVALEQSSGCEIVAADDPEGTGILILDSYLSTEVARNLYLNQYSYSIEQAGGLEAFQQTVDSLADTIDEPFAYISPAEEWALLELGVELPRGSSYRFNRS